MTWKVYQINGGPTKEMSEGFPIMISRFDSACFGLCLTLIEIRLVNILNASIHNQTFIKYRIDIMLLDYDGLSLAVVPKLVKQSSVWVLSVIHHGIIPLFATFIELMVEDGGIPVRIACPDNMWKGLPLSVSVQPKRYAGQSILDSDQVHVAICGLDVLEPTGYPNWFLIDLKSKFLKLNT